MVESSLQVVDRQTAPARQSFEPTTLQEAIEFSKMIADSELLPKDFRGKPGNILVALQIGKELNIPPLQALQGIYVVNGRGVVWGDLMWAIVTSHRDFEDAKEDVTDTAATVTLKRRGRSPVTVAFTIEDAKKAGLWAKQGPWTQYPKRQMLWRARTFAARDLFPDALKGMTSAEEANDYPGETIDASPSQGQGSQPAAQAEAPPAVIGTAKATEFFKLYKAQGWTPEESKAFLKEKFGIVPPRTSQDIPETSWDIAERWAKTKAPIREKAEELFNTLGWTKEECVKFVEVDHKWNWASIVEALQKELDKRNQAEQ